jgi:hypothetical protein
VPKSQPGVLSLKKAKSLLLLALFVYVVILSAAKNPRISLLLLPVFLTRQEL